MGADGNEQDKVYLDGTGAVSYTHLDVYKRQVVLHSVVNRLMANKKELKDYYYSPESAYEPVSYTHLDVYKRQPLAFGISKSVNFCPMATFFKTFR